MTFRWTPGTKGLSNVNRLERSFPWEMLVRICQSLKYFRSACRFRLSVYLDPLPKIEVKKRLLNNNTRGLNKLWSFIDAVAHASLLGENRIFWSHWNLLSQYQYTRIHSQTVTFLKIPKQLFFYMRVTREVEQFLP